MKITLEMNRGEAEALHLLLWTHRQEGIPRYSWPRKDQERAAAMLERLNRALDEAGEA